MEELAKIKPFVFDDSVTGQKISVEVSEFYGAILHIDDRSYYFHHGSGEMDGTSIDYGPEGIIDDQLDA